MKYRLIAGTLAVTLVGVAGAVWFLTRTAPANRTARDPSGCPSALAGLPPFWAASRDLSSGAYVLDEVKLCPGPPQAVRRLHDGIGWIGAGGGVVAVVDSSGPRDQIGVFDGKRVRRLPGVNPNGSAFTPAVSSTGDIAFVAYDPRTEVEAIEVLRRGAKGPVRLYVAPDRRKLSTPSWNSRGEVVAVERPQPLRPGVVRLVVVSSVGSAPAPHYVPLPRPNATTVKWLDDHRVVVGDAAAAEGGRPALVDVDRETTRLLPLGLVPVATVPGRAALLARDETRRLLLLDGPDLDHVVVLGNASDTLIGQGAFVPTAS